MPDIDQLKKKVRSERDIIFKAHREGLGGRETARRLTVLADDTIREMLEEMRRDNPARMNENLFAVVGVGGYGRRELCPCSDIDLLTLHESGAPQSAEYAANILVPALWDIGFEVGHVFTSVQETAEMSRGDMTVKTNLIHSQLVWGDLPLYQKFKKIQWDNTVKRDVKPFLRFLEDLRRAEARFPLGTTQPNLKHGAGGLRSLHSAIWAAYARFGMFDPDALQKRGILSAQDVSALEVALDFILRVRNELHFRENKRNDTLSNDVQESVASALGYSGDQQEAVQNLMRDYYKSVSVVRDISDGLFYSSKNYRQGLLKKARFFHYRRVGKGLTLFENEILLSSAPSFTLQENPGVILDVFRLFQEGEYVINQALRKSIRHSLDSLGADFFSSEDFRIFFLSVLGAEKTSRTLRALHECGILGRFLPEFEEITHTVPYDFYHAYTIDEHTFQCLTHLEALEEEASGTLPALYRHTEEKRLLKLALLLHDVGKPDREDVRTHSQISGSIAARVCAQLRLAEEETEIVVFLIKHHLMLNLVARRRDTHDSGIIHELATATGTRKKLDLLYLLTYADMRGVAPGVWSNWFAFLLEDLYQRTADFMNIDESDRPGDLEKVEAKKEKILRYLPRELSTDFALDFLSTSLNRYILSIPTQGIIDHISLAVTREKKKPAADIYYTGSHFTEMVVLSESRRGNLNRVAAVLSGMGINILETKIFRKKDGSSIDIFRFIDRYGKPVTDKDQLERIKEKILHVIGTRKAPTQGELKKAPSDPVPAPYKRVEIKNNISPAHTVIEIEAPDRIGLIQSITYAIFKMGLNIHLAKIDTEGSKAIDAFYVTDAKDCPLTEETQVNQLKKMLLEVI